MSAVNVGPSEFIVIAIVLLVWLGAVVHAARLGRPWMAVPLFFLSGLAIFWWPLHWRVPGRCHLATG